MANASGDLGTCLKLKEMMLSEDIHTSVDKRHFLSDKNVIDLELSSTQQKTETKLEGSSDCSQFAFDNVIGHLEDMLVDEEFHKLQKSFLEKYWKEFDDNEENKHTYMTIFNEYTNKIEDFITEYLKGRIKNFDMDAFSLQLDQRKDALEGEIFEVLLTLSDFKAFKEIFLDYRAMKEGHTIDLSESLCVSAVSL